MSYIKRFLAWAFCQHLNREPIYLSVDGVNKIVGYECPDCGRFPI